MKHRFLALGLVAAAFAAMAVFCLASEPSFAATPFAEHSWRDMIVQASPLLLTLRAQLSDVTAAATAKMAEAVDGLAPDALRVIETDHAALVEQANGIRAQIAAEEARLAAVNPAPADVNAAVTAALAAERTRVSDIQAIARGAGMADSAVTAAIAGNTSVEAFRAQAFDEMVRRAPPPTSPIRVTQDETETLRSAMQEALTIRLSPPAANAAQPSEAARSYMTFSIVDLAAERLGERRVPGSFGAREELLRRAFHNTSDFPILFEGALNSSLAARYRLAQPTYRRIARQRTYNDFRDHTTIRVGDFPDLQDVSPQGGEIKAGTFSESKEKTAVKAYGVRVDFSRQLLVNDTLDGISRVLADRGNAVARFEDRTFYAMMLSGASKDGPTLNDTARQVFNTTDLSKAGTATIIDIGALSAARAALRKRQTKDKVELELAGSILLCGPDRETQAQQVLAPVQAQQAGNVNPFSGTLSIVVTAKIIDYAWYVFATPEEAACFEWGLLDGYTAPRFRTDNPFGVQGVSMSLEHDFGCGAIDFRGGYKNAGHATQAST